MTPAWVDGSTTVYLGDVRELLAELREHSVHCVVTSPPYWNLRDYGTATWIGGEPDCDHVERHIRIGDGLAAWSAVHGAGGGHKAVDVPAIQYRAVCGRCGARRVDQQIGLERTPEEYVETIVDVFRLIRRVLRPDGVVWLNMGDTYARGKTGRDDEDEENLRRRFAEFGTGRPKAGRKGANGRDRGIPNGYKDKDLLGMPWAVAFALRGDGWYLRRDVVWSKANPMPESVRDRPTSAHEFVFLLSPSEDYFYDLEATKEPASPLTNPRGHGVNPKALMKPKPGGWDMEREGRGPKRWATPAGWNTGPGGHETVAGRYPRDPKRPRNKQNESFSGAVRGPVRERNVRSVWEADEPWAIWEWLLDQAEDGMERRLVERLFERYFASDDVPDVWKIATEAFPAAHFATFPQDLVVPCILAGTSARGCCPTCGAPWRRLVDRRTENCSNAARAGTTIRGKGHVSSQVRAGHDVRNGPTSVTATIGWQPTCNHYDTRYRTDLPQARQLRKRKQRQQTGDWWRRARRRPGRDDWPTVPAVVLDPFAGSGTTLAVARRLGRAGVGLDLQPEYLELIRRRVLAAALPLLDGLEQTTQPEADQMELIS